MSYLFEQAGTQKQLTEAGLWYATASEEDLIELMRQEPGLLRDWDEKYGDRMQKIVFIGQHMDKEQIIRDLDEMSGRVTIKLILMPHKQPGAGNNAHPCPRPLLGG
mgnify:CR=1 FL=1